MAWGALGLFGNWRFEALLGAWLLEFESLNPKRIYIS
jgi:hypothetical protein